ncbi:hypothetical protein SK128_011030, partial [Halocaridina rubra]
FEGDIIEHILGVGSKRLQRKCGATRECDSGIWKRLVSALSGDDDEELRDCVDECARYLEQNREYLKERKHRAYLKWMTVNGFHFGAKDFVLPECYAEFGKNERRVLKTRFPFMDI